MAEKNTHLWKLKTHSFSLPFRVFGYRLSAGVWFRRVKDVADPSPRIDNHTNGGPPEYEPLPSHRYIRLLELHPGSSNEPLCGTLRIVSLDSVPEYKALSYVWGDIAIVSQIRLGGGRCLPLRSNLTDALYQLRHERHPQTLWIDGICINQEDFEERGSQVKLMAEIYSRCDSVLVWLGKPTRHSQLGFRILSYLANGDGRINQDSPPWDDFTGGEAAAALRGILKRPYFGRLWVVQEAALAQRVTMRMGGLSVGWSDGMSTRQFLARIKLAELSPWWQESAELRDTVDLRPLRELLEQSLAAAAKRRGVVEVPSLLDVVHSMRHRQATNPHDKIYGLMSLVTPAEVAEIVPDYRESWETTYRRFYEIALRQVLRDPEITLENMEPMLDHHT